MRAPRLLEAGSLATLAGQSDLARTALDRAISDALDGAVSDETVAQFAGW